ncbi:MAG TPA: hypothetical protein VK171_07830 [Fimbriimonas sp.]|nr:hypothetical protein [Fimbriimonas sp.]
MMNRVVFWCSTAVAAGVVGCSPRVTALAVGSPAMVPPPVQAGGSKGLFLDGVFPIGVFSQPEQSFAKWKGRGINTILETPQGHDPVSWDNAARAAGLYVIRRPMKDPRQDIGRKDLLAWSHWDEPDAAGRISQWTPMFEKTASEWRAIDPSRRIFINFAGPDLSWFTTRSDAYSKEYASYYPRLLNTADWIANDLYPCGGWLNQAHAPRRGDITLLGEPIRILKSMTNKPQFAFIEASEVERGNVPGARCPTAAEFKAEIWYAITQGVRGLFYFPAVVGKSGFAFDGMPAELVEVMTQQNAIISRVAPLLQGEIDPAGFGADVPEGVACGWRKSGNSVLVVLVNTRPSGLNGASIRLKGLDKVANGYSHSAGGSVALAGGVLKESFEPFGVRVLQFELK